MVRNAWLSVYLKEHERDIIKTNTGLFKQLVTVSQSQYVAGRKKQQDVLQAEVELSLIEDQLEKSEAELEIARAALAQWVGEESAQQALNTDTDFLGKLMLSEQQMSAERLLTHPSVGQNDATVEVAQFEVELAQEKSGTQWGFDVSYGFRQGDNPAMAGGGPRPDFLSMVAMVSIPVFADDKNDRVISSSKQMLQAKKYQRQDVLRELQSQLKQTKARWYKTNDRIDRYEARLLPQAKQNAKAAMSAYQSGVGSFVELTRARVSEFTAQLSHIKLIVEKARTLADIRYLVGEE
jgi:outer membrane protein TolC